MVWFQIGRCKVANPWGGEGKWCQSTADRGRSWQGKLSFTSCAVGTNATLDMYKCSSRLTHSWQLTQWLKRRFEEMAARRLESRGGRGGFHPWIRHLCESEWSYQAVLWLPQSQPGVPGVCRSQRDRQSACGFRDEASLQKLFWGHDLPPDVFLPFNLIPISLLMNFLLFVCNL